jgi:hypothetical protein
MPKYIAVRKLIAVSLDSGERKEVTYRVGYPYWTEGDEFASCPVVFEGMFDQLADTKGIDELQALHLASDLDGILRVLRNKYQFYWQSGEPYFDDETKS